MPVQFWTVAQIADRTGLKDSKISSLLRSNGITEAYSAGQTRLYSEDQLPEIEHVLRRAQAKKPQVMRDTGS
jgi:hypothetical protein